METCVICWEALSISPFKIRADKANENAQKRALYAKATGGSIYNCRQRRPCCGKFSYNLDGGGDVDIHLQHLQQFENFELLGMNPFVQGSAAKTVSSESVVLHPCGHLSHFICLETRQRAFRPPESRAARATDSVECPACGKPITLTRIRLIDLAAHEGFSDKFTKDIQYLQIMTTELEEQHHCATTKCESIDRALQDIMPIVRGLEVRLETYHADVYRHTLIDSTKRTAAETETTLASLREHSIILAQTLLSRIKDIPPTVLATKGIVPTELIRVLPVITNNREILEKIVDIIAPVSNGPDRQLLTAEIFAAVDTSLKDRLEQFNEDIKNTIFTPTEQRTPRIKGKPSKSPAKNKQNIAVPRVPQSTKNERVNTPPLRSHETYFNATNISSPLENKANSAGKSHTHTAPKENDFEISSSSSESQINYEIPSGSEQNRKQYLPKEFPIPIAKVPSGRKQQDRSTPTKDDKLVTENALAVSTTQNTKTISKPTTTMTLTTAPETRPQTNFSILTQSDYDTSESSVESQIENNANRSACLSNENPSSKNASPRKETYDRPCSKQVGSFGGIDEDPKGFTKNELSGINDNNGNICNQFLMDIADSYSMPPKTNIFILKESKGEQSTKSSPKSTIENCAAGSYSSDTSRQRNINPHISSRIPKDINIFSDIYPNAEIQPPEEKLTVEKQKNLLPVSFEDKLIHICNPMPATDFVNLAIASTEKRSGTNYSILTKTEPKSPVLSSPKKVQFHNDNPITSEEEQIKDPHPISVIPMIINVPSSTYTAKKNGSISTSSTKAKKSSNNTSKNCSHSKQSKNKPKILPLFLINQSSSQNRSSSMESVVTDEEEDRRLMERFINRHYLKRYSPVKNRKTENSAQKKQVPNAERTDNNNNQNQSHNLNLPFLPVPQMETTQQQQQLNSSFKYPYDPQPLQFLPRVPMNHQHYIINNADVFPVQGFVPCLKQQNFYAPENSGLQVPFSGVNHPVMQMAPECNLVYDPYAFVFQQKPPPFAISTQQQNNIHQYFQNASPAANNSAASEAMIDNNTHQEFIVLASQRRLQEQSSPRHTFMDIPPRPTTNERVEIQNVCRWLSPPPSSSSRTPRYQNSESDQNSSYFDEDFFDWIRAHDERFGNDPTERRFIEQNNRNQR